MQFNSIIMTGHTNGVGKDLYDHFVAEGKAIVGYDLDQYTFDEALVDKLIEDSKTTDVFINNLPYGELQIDLAKKWFEVNQDRQTVMLCINSVDFHDYLETDPDEAMRQYTANKINLSIEIFERIKLLKTCKFIIVAPGIALTNKDNDALKSKLRGPQSLIDKKEVTMLIDWAINSYEETILPCKQKP